MTDLMAEYRALIEYGGEGSVADFVESLTSQLAAAREERDEARQEAKGLREGQITGIRLRTEAEAQLAALRAEVARVAQTMRASTEWRVVVAWADALDRALVAPVEEPTPGAGAAPRIGSGGVDRSQHPGSNADDSTVAPAGSEHNIGDRRSR